MSCAQIDYGDRVCSAERRHIIQHAYAKLVSPPARAEYQFNLLRGSADVNEVVSAWRVSGGAFFKVQLKRSIVCDTRHACSCKACNHACELAIIIICFGCTAGVFAMLVNSKAFEKERKQTGRGSWNLLMGLFVLTVVTAIFTLRRLMQRWCTASTDVFVSEV